MSNDNLRLFSFFTKLGPSNIAKHRELIAECVASWRALGLAAHNRDMACFDAIARASTDEEITAATAARDADIDAHESTTTARFNAAFQALEDALKSHGVETECSCAMCRLKAALVDVVKGAGSEEGPEMMAH